MASLLTYWEFGWLPANVESSMWRQLKAAYQIDHFAMVSSRPDPDNVIKFESMETAIQQYGGTPVFLIPNHGHDLQTFHHPEDATYIFGNAYKSNVELAKSMTCQIVKIPTPKNVDFFAVNAAATVLYDRMLKCPQI